MKKKKTLHSSLGALDGSTSQITLSIIYNEQSYETHRCVTGSEKVNIIRSKNNGLIEYFSSSFEQFRAIAKTISN